MPGSGLSLTSSIEERSDGDDAFRGLDVSVKEGVAEADVAPPALVHDAQHPRARAQALDEQHHPATIAMPTLARCVRRRLSISPSAFPHSLPHFAVADGEDTGSA